MADTPTPKRVSAADADLWLLRQLATVDRLSRQELATRRVVDLGTAAGLDASVARLYTERYIGKSGSIGKRDYSVWITGGWHVLAAAAEDDGSDRLSPDACTVALSGLGVNWSVRKSNSADGQEWSACAWTGPGTYCSTGPAQTRLAALRKLVRVARIMVPQPDA